MARQRCQRGSRRSSSGRTCRRKRSKTRRYSLNYGRIFGRR